MPLSKPQRGGDYFQPANHMQDFILVIEGKKILKDQPHEYDGIKSTRDVAIADIACFRTEKDIEDRKPSLVMKDAQVTNGILVADIERNGWLDGEGGLAVIRKPKRAYVWRDEFTPAAEEAAIAWYEARDAEIAKNLDDVPDF